MSGLAVVLVEPQLAENIGMVARAMGNFGLDDLRLVAPRDGWPKKGARTAASGAAGILERARLYATAREAVADLRFVLAATARERGQMKRVLGPAEAMREAVAHAGGHAAAPAAASTAAPAEASGALVAAGPGAGVGVLFGRERTGLENDEVSLADAIVTFPVDPAHPSLNLAQAVLLVAYEWRRATGLDSLPFTAAPAAPAPREMLTSLFDYLEEALDAAGFYPPDKRPVMARNLRDMILRMGPSEQDVRTLRGAVRALAEGRARKILLTQRKGAS